MPATHSAPRRRLRVAVSGAATLAAAGYLLAAVAVGHVPGTQTVTRREPVTQSLAVGYSGMAKAGAAYPDGRVTTGDPIFTRLVSSVDVHVAYELRSARDTRVGGTYDVVANVSNAGGWSRSLALTPARPFAGDHFDATVTLELARLRRFEARFSAETGLDTTQTTVSIAPRVHVAGDLAGTPFATGITSTLDFQLGPLEMTPTSAGTTAGTGATDAPGAPATTKTGSVSVRAAHPGELSVWKLRVPVGLARLLLLVAVAISVAAFAAVMLLDRRRVAMGEADAIVRRYGQLLIDTASVPVADERALVRVESMHALARLAHLHEHPILHTARAGGGDQFVLPTESVVYCYEIARSGRPAALVAVAAAS